MTAVECTPSDPCGHCDYCADVRGNGSGAAGDAEDQAPSSWAPVDLTTARADTEQPRWLHRSDGLTLLYPRRIHWVSGEPETAKSWLALTAVNEVLAAGGRVAIIDYGTWIAG